MVITRNIRTFGLPAASNVFVLAVPKATYNPWVCRKLPIHHPLRKISHAASLPVMPGRSAVDSLEHAHVEQLREHLVGATRFLDAVGDPEADLIAKHCFNKLQRRLWYIVRFQIINPTSYTQISPAENSCNFVERFEAVGVGSSRRIAELERYDHMRVGLTFWFTYRRHKNCSAKSCLFTRKLSKCARQNVRKFKINLKSPEFRKSYYSRHFTLKI